VDDLIRPGELSTFVKVAWLLWLVWGLAQVEWRRRGRVAGPVPAWLPPPVPAPVARVRLLPPLQAPVLSPAVARESEPLASAPEPELSVSPRTPKRRRRSRAGVVATAQASA
jgi:hypothetical protein